MCTPCYVPLCSPSPPPTIYFSDEESSHALSPSSCSNDRSTYYASVHRDKEDDSDESSDDSDKSSIHSVESDEYILEEEDPGGVTHNTPINNSVSSDDFPYPLIETKKFNLTRAPFMQMSLF